MRGERGPQGLMGPIPPHEVKQGAVRFKKDDGTWGEWIDTKGEKGESGASAYDHAVERGFKGDLSEWLQSLQGRDGKDGRNGRDGLDGKAASRGAKGEKGDKGDKGEPGRDGKDGEDGKSAYEIWLEQGNYGTEQDFLKAISGNTGGAGPLRLTMNSLTGVDIQNPQTGQTIVYDGSKWRNEDAQGGSGTWGSISGTLSNQEDLQNALDEKFALPSLTAGSVLFSNGSTIAQDNANLFWDDTNNRLGIGTSAPAAKLHVSGGQARLPNGSVIAGNSPGIAFDSYPNDGIASNGGNLAFWQGGTISLNLTDVLKEFRVPSDYKYAWASSTNNNTGADTYISRSSAGVVFTDKLTVTDEAYGTGWDGNTEVPTKNAIYEKIESIAVPSVKTTTVTIPDGRGVFEHFEVITDASVTTSSHIIPSLGYMDNTEENDMMMLNIASIAARPRNGDFVLNISFNELTSGPININYIVG